MTKAMPLPNWQAEIDQCKAKDLYRKRRSPSNASLVSFATNDYLGLADDPRLANAASEAAQQWGIGATASPLIAGYSEPLRRLEERLAQWEGTESALVFASGFAANLGTIAAIAGPEDTLFSDALNHASLIDGCRISRATTYVYRHVDLNHLEDLLQRHGASARRRIIVTDSVFSMDGDLAPLAELCELAERFAAVLLIDEAHATGVFGERGTGLTELAENAWNRLPAECRIKVGTLSKALGCQGGFVAGSRALIEYLVNLARPYVYSTALAPPIAAAATVAIDIAEREQTRRAHLLELVHRFQRNARTPIVPIVLGDTARTLAAAQALEQAGFLVPGIRPPTVPVGTSRLRISLSARHTVAQVERLIETLRSLELN